MLSQKAIVAIVSAVAIVAVAAIGVAIYKDAHPKDDGPTEEVYYFKDVKYFEKKVEIMDRAEKEGATVYYTDPRINWGYVTNTIENNGAYGTFYDLEHGGGQWGYDTIDKVVFSK